MRWITVFVLASFSISACAQQATLQKQPGLRHTRDTDLQAFPRVLTTADVPEAVAAKINLSLKRFNAEVLADRLYCAKQGSTKNDPGMYTRSIEVTMTGPRYLSFFVQDSYDCGGPHPEDDALVYDLTTGSPVNWNTLLPAAAKGEIIQTPHQLSIGVVHWPAMLKRARAMAIKADPDADCGSTYDSFPELIGFDVFLSADDRTIALSPKLTPHIASAFCTAVVLIPPEEAKRLGVSPLLVQALEEARLSK